MIKIKANKTNSHISVDGLLHFTIPLTGIHRIPHGHRLFGPRGRCGHRHHVGDVGQLVAHVHDGAHHPNGGSAQVQMEADLDVRAGRRKIPAATATRGFGEVHGTGALHQQCVADRSDRTRRFPDVVWHPEHSVLAGVRDVSGGLSGAGQLNVVAIGAQRMF